MIISINCKTNKRARNLVYTSGTNGVLDGVIFSTEQSVCDRMDQGSHTGCLVGEVTLLHLVSLQGFRDMSCYPQRMTCQGLRVRIQSETLEPSCRPHPCQSPNSRVGVRTGTLLRDNITFCNESSRLQRILSATTRGSLMQCTLFFIRQRDALDA